MRVNVDAAPTNSPASETEGPRLQTCANWNLYRKPA